MANQDGSETSDSLEITRRRAIVMGGIGAAGLLAGCQGDDSEGTPGDSDGSDTDGSDGSDGSDGDGGGDGGDGGDGDDGGDTDTGEGPEFVEGQELRLATDVDPLKTTFLTFGPWDSYVDSSLIPHAEEEMKDPMIWLREEIQDTKVLEARLYDDWNIDLNNGVVEFTIREDGKWSDGEDVTARDVLAQAGFIRLTELSNADGGKSFLPKLGTNGFRRSWEDYELPDGPDGKRIRFLAHRDGAFDHLDKDHVLEQASGLHMSPHSPTHLEPVDSIADDVMENLDTAIKNPDDTESWNKRDKIANRHVTKEHLENWRDPGFVASNGAWQLEKVRGSQEFILSQNPEYYAADDVNFSRVVYEYTPAEARQQAALQSGLLDSGTVSFSAGAMESLPDKYEQINVPTGGPGVLGFDHNHFAFQHQKVRQAVAYAIDSKAAANNVHPKGTVPYNIPGGDNYKRSEVVSDEWVEQNLIDYSQDLDKAEAKMQEAGFSRNGNGVWEKDGQMFNPTLHTYSGDPVFETTVADQLSQFGIETDVQSHDEATYEDRWKGGEFSLFVSWRGPYMNSSIDSLGHFWYGILIHESFVDTFNIYDDEKEQQAVDGYGESGWVGGSGDKLEGLEIEVPPIGEPDGSLSPVEPSFNYYQATYASQGKWFPKTAKNYYQSLMWIMNWYLPAVPVYSEVSMNWINTVNWNWPKDNGNWEFFGDNLFAGHFNSMGKIKADPDNPK